LFGLKTNNNSSDPDNDIDFGPGEARDSVDEINIINTSTITKRIDAQWAAGTGLGGLAQGILLVGQKTYHGFILSNEVGDIDAGFDDDPTGATLLADPAVQTAGFTHLRRTNSFVTEPLATIAQYIQVGDRFIYAEDTLEIALTTPALTSGVVADVNVPSKVNALALGNVFMDHTATNIILLRVSTVSIPDVPPTNDNKTLAVGNTSGPFQGRQSTFVETLVDHPIVANRGQIRFRTNAPTGGEAAVSYTLAGWIDTRDRS
jgi:hypothetical protein